MNDPYEYLFWEFVRSFGFNWPTTGVTFAMAYMAYRFLRIRRVKKENINALKISRLARLLTSAVNLKRKLDLTKAK